MLSCSSLQVRMSWRSSSSSRKEVGVGCVYCDISISFYVKFYAYDLLASPTSRIWTATGGNLYYRHFLRGRLAVSGPLSAGSVSFSLPSACFYERNRRVYSLRREHLHCRRKRWRQDSQNFSRTLPVSSLSNLSAGRPGSAPADRLYSRNTAISGIPNPRTIKALLPRVIAVVLPYGGAQLFLFVQLGDHPGCIDAPVWAWSLCLPWRFPLSQAAAEFGGRTRRMGRG